MSDTLKTLFDFQKFENNESLAKLIKETEERYASVISLDDLEMISAAGTPEKKKKEEV